MDLILNNAECYHGMAGDRKRLVNATKFVDDALLRDLGRGTIVIGRDGVRNDGSGERFTQASGGALSRRFKREHSAG